MAKDYYQTLGIKKAANKDEIKKAYRELAHKYHPDKVGGDEKKFKEINEAYQVLSDEKKRAQYDQFGSAFEQAGAGSQQGFGFQDFNFGGGNMNDIFEQMFDFGMGQSGMHFRTGGQRQQRGEDITVEREITLEEAFSGKDETLSLKRFATCPRCKGSRKEEGSSTHTCRNCSGKGVVQKMQRTILGSFMQTTVCPECRGEGHIIDKPCKECRGDGRVQKVENVRVHIPAGISNEEVLRISHEGQAGMSGQKGDLYLRVYVKKHPVFLRDHDDLVSEITIPISLASLGGKTSVRSIDGKGDLEIAPGIQSGSMLRVRGKGMPHLERGGRGDQYVKVLVETPKKLSRKAKELLEELKKEGL